MQEERKRILKLVEEGKMSAEEALKLLNELDASQQTNEKKQQELVTELSTVVNFEQDGKKADESYQYTFQSLKDKITDFLDTAFKKLKDFDLDFNFGPSLEISHIFQQGGVTLRDIDVDMANGSVQFIPWDQGDVRIECNAKVYRGSNQDEARAHFLREILFNADRKTLRFAVHPKWMKVDAVVYVPQTDYENVRVRMFNGPVQCENLKAKSLKIKTANGKIAATHVEGSKMEVETGNGKIKIENSKMKELEAETLNGAIQVDGEFSEVEIQSFNGNISCQLTGAGKEFEAKTVTGSIDLAIPAHLSVSGELKSNLGGFSVELDNIQIISEKNEVVQKSMYFKPVAAGQQPFSLYAETKTGSISVKKNDPGK
jgi:DUF4097 and DUF4098 domain-containing protein YvlB